MYAITAKGIGRPVGARKIKPDWQLADGETFTVEQYSSGMVLAEDERSLRLPNEAELVEGMKAEKVAELRAACRAHIFAGFDSDALGAVHRYPLSHTDQANNQKAETAAMKNANTAGWTRAMQCIDGKGVVAYRPHTAGQVLKAIADIEECSESALLKLQELIMQVNDPATDTQAKLDKIQW